MSDKTVTRTEWEDRLLSVLRIMAGLAFLEHGSAKIFDFPHLATHAPYHLFSLVPGLAGLLEFFGGILITIGLFTRPVAFILAGEMAVGYFMSHFPRSFFPLLNGGDAVLLYCFIFLFLSAAGCGAWGLDRSRGAEDRD